MTKRVDRFDSCFSPIPVSHNKINHLTRGYTQPHESVNTEWHGQIQAILSIFIHSHKNTYSIDPDRVFDELAAEIVS